MFRCVIVLLYYTECSLILSPPHHTHTAVVISSLSISTCFIFIPLCSLPCISPIFLVLLLFLMHLCCRSPLSISLSVSYSSLSIKPSPCCSLWEKWLILMFLPLLSFLSLYLILLTFPSLYICSLLSVSRSHFTWISLSLCLSIHLLVLMILFYPCSCTVIYQFNNLSILLPSALLSLSLSPVSHPLLFFTAPSVKSCVKWTCMSEYDN